MEGRHKLKYCPACNMVYGKNQTNCGHEMIIMNENDYTYWIIKGKPVLDASEINGQTKRDSEKEIE